MNKYLKIKNEEFVKHNATDFYVMSIYSMELLGKDLLRLDEFRAFKKDQTNRHLNGHIVLLNVAISALLIYRFKSFLIVPTFYGAYFILNKIFLKKDCLQCYFCERQENKTEKLRQYESYYALINYTFKRNRRIRNINDFECELDKIIKELKY
jgi:hypothetical protein